MVAAQVERTSGRRRRTGSSGRKRSEDRLMVEVTNQGADAAVTKGKERGRGEGREG